MITIELLKNNDYEQVSEEKDVAAIVNDFNMPFEYLEYCMFVKYDFEGNVDTVFGCLITSRATMFHAISISKNLQLLITDNVLRIYESSSTIEAAICEILQELK